MILHHGTDDRNFINVMVPMFEPCTSRASDALDAHFILPKERAVCAW